MECAQCRQPFEPSKRANQFGRGVGARHEGARYCSPKCRQQAYRLRQGRVTVASDSPPPVQPSRPSQPASARAAAPVIGQSRSVYEMPADAVVSDWKPCLPSDWTTLPDLPIPDFLRR